MKILEDKKISLKAKALYIQMHSNLRYNWTVKAIASKNKDGEVSIVSAIDELKKSGWIDRKIIKTDGGQFKIEQMLHDESQKA